MLVSSRRCARPAATTSTPPAASWPATSRTAPASAERIAQQRTVMLKPVPRGRRRRRQGEHDDGHGGAWPPRGGAGCGRASLACWLAARGLRRAAAPAPAAIADVRHARPTKPRRASARASASSSRSGYFEQGKTDDRARRAEAGRSPSIPTFADAYNLRGLIYMRLNDNAPGRGELPPRRWR